MNDLLRAHPDLVAELDPDATRRCGVLTGAYGTSWQCSRPARWRVLGGGYPPQCGQHAARSLRRELQAGTDAAAGA